MNPLAWLNPGRWMLYVGFALALWLGYTHWCEHQREIGRAEVRAEITTQALKAEKVQRAEEQRRAAVQQEIVNEANQRAQENQAAAAAARTVADSLRRELAAFRDRARKNPAAASTSKATEDPIGVLAELFDSADQRAGILAEAADQARTAGLACQQAYDSLTAQ